MAIKTKAIRALWLSQKGILTNENVWISTLLFAKQLGFSDLEAGTTLANLESETMSGKQTFMQAEVQKKEIVIWSLRFLIRHDIPYRSGTRRELSKEIQDLLNQVQKDND